MNVCHSCKTSGLHTALLVQSNRVRPGTITSVFPATDFYNISTTVMDLVKKGLSIAQDHRQTRWIAPLLLLADVALCGLIIWKVPCEHEYSWTYSEHI